MKKVSLLIGIFLFFIISTNTYSFQFGFGTKGFTRNVLEKGQSENKIPKTKQEKESNKQYNENNNTGNGGSGGGGGISYSGSVKKFDLSQARYLFVAEKSAQTQYAPALKKSKSLYKQPSIGQKVLFKVKEDGSIEEVKIHDETGLNEFDVNVNYVVKVGTGFISVALDIKGVWVVTISSEVVEKTVQVEGSTETITVEEIVYSTNTTYVWLGYYKYYLVRLEDGAVYEGNEMLPNLDNKTIYEDMYGNFYYMKNSKIIKLNTSNMSIQTLSAEGDSIYSDMYFCVDKFGNLLYYLFQSNTYRYRKTTSTIDGDIIHDTFYPVFSFLGGSGLITTDINRDCIFHLRRGSSNENYAVVINTIKCNYDTGYKVVLSSTVKVLGNYAFTNYSEILSVGDREISLFTQEPLDNILAFSKLNLIDATTSYYYEMTFNELGISQNDLSYKIVNSTTVYLLVKKDDFSYSIVAVYPEEQRKEVIFDTTEYELKSDNWEVDIEGNIIISAIDLYGNKVLLKITPKNNIPEILKQGSSEIYYLTRVY